MCSSMGTAAGFTQDGKVGAVKDGLINRGSVEKPADGDFKSLQLFPTSTAAQSTNMRANLNEIRFCQVEKFGSN